MVVAVSWRREVVLEGLVRVSQAGRLSMFGRAAGSFGDVDGAGSAADGVCRDMGKVV